MADEATTHEATEAEAVEAPELDVVDQGNAGTGVSEVDWQARFEAQQKVNRDLERKMKGEAGTLRAQLEELQTKLADQETEYQTAAARALRYEVAADAGLPLTVADRLQGATREDLEKDAESLGALLGRSTGSADAGVRNDPPVKVSQNDLIRSALRR